MARLIRGQALNHFAQSRQGQINTFALRECMARIGADSWNNLSSNKNALGSRFLLYRYLFSHASRYRPGQLGSAFPSWCGVGPEGRCKPLSATLWKWRGSCKRIAGLIVKSLQLFIVKLQPLWIALQGALFSGRKIGQIPFNRKWIRWGYLDEWEFMVVAEVILLAIPCLRSSAQCATVSTWCIVRSENWD